MNTGPDIIEELREAIAPELHLLERLGAGGMADVFLARDPVLKRNVAIKVLAARLGLSDQARRRFAREAESAAAVAHPNVVPIYRVGVLPRTQLGYIVMAHVDGPTLRELVPEGTVASESDVRRIMADVAAALAAAHGRGVVHRDIKPANVLYDQLGGRFIVVDFGIAAVLNRDTDGAGVRLTMEGVPVGTPEYMSPEQAAGDPVAEKSDVYSLGCLAYELLTGKPPITGSNPAAVVRGHLYQQPAPVGAQRSDVSPELAALIMRCLRKEPDERPDADEITRALGWVRRARIEWPPPGLEVLHREGARWGRSLGRFAIALFLFVLILGIHPAVARPCCAASPDRSPGWLLLKRLSIVTPIHFDDPDALSIWYFLLDASFFVALAALIPFAVRTVTLTGKLVAGRGSGYPLPVLARVAWDRHRDSGDLLNLSGRYALLPPDRQTRVLRRRAIATAAISAAFVLLIGSCLAWLGGLLELGTDPSTGLLPVGELLLVAVPAGLLTIVYIVLEGLDLGHRGVRRRRGARQSPLRRDVLNSWMQAAGAQPSEERWSSPLVRVAGALGVAVAILTVVVAAYGLTAVFGSSARFAGDRAGARDWLKAYQEPEATTSSLPRLTPRSALVLAASIPVETEVTRVMLDRRLPAGERTLILQSVGPAFCLNPREVLFGIAPARLREREQLARLIDSAALGADDEFDPGPLTGGWVAGLRRRARYCYQYFGAQATISPNPRPRE